MALDARRPAQHGAAMFTRLETIIVDKPWGRVDIPRDFGDFGDRRVGEIWFAHPVGDDAPIMVKFLFTRSEEHTSELQSLMRISYAVFCLKKKKKKKQTKYNRLQNNKQTK